MNVTFTETLDARTCAEWDEFWRTSRHTHPRQHSAVAATEVAKGRRPIFAAARDDGRIAAVAAISVRPLLPGGLASGEAVCIRGPAFDDVGAGRALLGAAVARLRGLHVGRIRIAPHWMYPEAGAVESMLGELGFEPLDAVPRDDTGWVDLSRGDDAILASFTGSTRKEIRLAARRGIDVRPLTNPGEAQAAFRCISSRRRSKALSPVGRREFVEVFERVYRGGRLGVLVGAMKGPRLLGALAVMRSAHLAHPTLYSVDPDAGRETSNLNIGAALWWRAFLWAKSQGCSHLDVEGNVLPLDPSHPRYEYENFKRRFRPEPKQRLGEHVLVCHPTLWAVHRHAQRVPSLCRKAAAGASLMLGRHPRGVTRSRPILVPSTSGGAL